MKRLLFLTSFILLSGCDNNTKIAESYAEKTIGVNLKDPDSAKFSSVVTHRIKQGDGYADLVHVCGLVSAKNGFGAYTGNSRFIVSFLDKPQPELVTQAIEKPDSREAFESVYWNGPCSVNSS